MDKYDMYYELYNIPPEIIKFYFDIFELHEIRARVGHINGIQFDVRSKESNHNIPHIHARYGGFEISISLVDYKVLAGNLPSKQQKKAVNWVKTNKNLLLTRWSDISIKGEIPLTGSNLSTKSLI